MADKAKPSNESSRHSIRCVFLVFLLKSLLTTIFLFACIRRNLRIPSTEQRKTPQSKIERETLVSTSNAKRKLRLQGRSIYGSQQTIHQTDDRRGTLRRSSSMTTLRTPNKRSPGKNQPTTSEQNRKASSENAQKVLKTLHRDETFFNRLHLGGGLKSMTAKQFVDIVAHFIFIIAGKNINSNRQTDCEADILIFIKTINYPNMVNKSWLKTPNAPHAYHECVALLAWLADFVDNETKIDEEQYFPIEHDADFPNINFTTLFSEEIRNGFRLWNSQEDEEWEKMKQILIESNIVAWMNNQIKTRAELELITENLIIDCKELESVNCSIKNKKRFEAIESQFLQNELLLKKLETSCEQKADRLASIEVLHSIKKDTVTQKEKSVENLLYAIKHQKQNIQDFHELNKNISTIKKTIEFTKNEIVAIKSDGVVQQVQLARSIQQKNDAITKLNQIIFKLSQLLLKSKSNIALNINDVHIDPSASNLTIKNICHKLNQAIDQGHCITQQNNDQFDCNTVKIKELTLAEKHYAVQQDEYKTNIQKLNKQLYKIDEFILNEQDSKKNIFEELQRKLEELKDDQHKANDDIRISMEKYAHLKIQNEKILEAGEKRAYALISMKAQLIDDIDNVMRFMDHLKNANNYS